MILDLLIIVLALAGVTATSRRPRAMAILIMKATFVMGMVGLLFVGFYWMFEYVEFLYGVVNSPLFVVGGGYLTLFSFGYILGYEDVKTASLLHQVLLTLIISIGIPLVLTHHLIATTTGEAGFALVVLIPALFSGSIFPMIGLAVGRAKFQKRKEARMRHAT